MPHRISPLWWTPVLPLLFFISAVMAGLSMGIIAYRVSVRIHDAPEDKRVVAGLAKGVVGAGALFLALRLGALIWNGELARLDWGDALTWLLILEVVGAGVLPLLLLAIPAARRNTVVQWVAPGMILAGVLLNRFSLTLFANTAPIQRAAYVPSAMEWLTTIGILAMALLAWYAGVRWLVRFDGSQDHAH
jgi:Ni/Fe-hydrogenase subunit HybB-like protein